MLRVDLRTWGATGLQGWIDKPIKPAPDRSLTFLDNSTLAVSFPVFNPEAKLSTREHPGGASIVFHTALVDVHTGQVKGERNWGSVYLPHTMVGIRGGRLLVRTGDDLGIYSPDWKLEQHYQLASTGDEYGSARVEVSPSGKTAYVISREAPNRERVQILGDSNGEQSFGFTVNSTGTDAISDSHFVFVLPEDKQSAFFALSLKAMKGKSPRPPKPLSYKGEGDCARPVFVAGDLMVLAGLCHSILLLQADGGVLAKMKLGEPDLVHNVRASRDQPRFALLLSETRFATVPGEERTQVFRGAQVRVYEIDRQFDEVGQRLKLRKLFQRQLDIGNEEEHRVDLALSPDGSLLALLNGWNLTVYRLR